jgi:ornithine decarboxylase
MNPSRRSQLRDELRSDADRLTTLAERHGTPLLVLQPHLAARRYRLLAERLSGFELHYAVKALPHPIVLTTIALCGGGFDVATSAEVDLLQQLGLPMDRCIHTNPIKKPADIDHAYAAGIRTFVVENPCEHRNSRAGPTTSSCWCGWPTAIRPRNRTCRRSSA